MSAHLISVCSPHDLTTSGVRVKWAMRRRGSQLHLCRRYTTAVWPALAKLAAAYAESTWRIVAPLVSKHVDFLTALTAGAAPATSEFSKEALSAALSSPHVFLLLGSAPVGPSTVAAVLVWLCIRSLIQRTYSAWFIRCSKYLVAGYQLSGVVRPRLVSK